MLWLRALIIQRYLVKPLMMQIELFPMGQDYSTVGSHVCSFQRNVRKKTRIKYLLRTLMNTKKGKNDKSN